MLFQQASSQRVPNQSDKIIILFPKPLLKQIQQFIHASSVSERFPANIGATSRDSALSHDDVSKAAVVAAIPLLTKCRRVNDSIIDLCIY